MPAKAPLHLLLDAFPKDGRTWQVVAHGKIRAPSEVDEASCEVFLAEACWDQPRHNEPPPARTERVWIGLGQLLLASVGSLWRDGECIAPTTRRQSRIEVVAASSKWPNKVLGRTIAHQRSDQRPWTPAYPVGDCNDLPLFRIETADGGALWVSPLELARATFGVTSEWLRLMLEGGMHVLPDLRRRIIDPERSYRLANDPRTLSVSAYRWLEPGDVEVAARICSDKSLRQSFDGVTNHLRRQGFGRAPAHVLMPFPFVRPSVWLVEECWVTVAASTGGSRTFRLVTHIASIMYELGLDHVRVLYPGKSPKDDQAGETESEPANIRLGARAELSEQIDVVTGLPSWSALGVFDKESSDHRAASGWTIEHVPVEPNGEPSAKEMLIVLDAPVREATTADKGTKSERTGRTAIKTNVKDKVQAKADIPRPPLARLASTLAALERLSSDQRRELHIVQPTTGPGADPIDRLWRYPSDGHRRVRRWAVTRDGRARRALVVRIAGSRGWIYAIEAEHLEIVVGDVTAVANGDGEVARQDGYSALCLIEIRGPDILASETIGDLLRLQASERGVWRRHRLAVPMTRITRPNLWLHDHALYSRRIALGIAELEGQGV